MDPQDQSYIFRWLVVVSRFQNLYDNWEELLVRAVVVARPAESVWSPGISINWPGKEATAEATSNRNDFPYDHRTIVSEWEETDWLLCLPFLCQWPPQINVWPYITGHNYVGEEVLLLTTTGNVSDTIISWTILTRRTQCVAIRWPTKWSEVGGEYKNGHYGIKTLVDDGGRDVSLPSITHQPLHPLCPQIRHIDSLV